MRTNKSVIRMNYYDFCEAVKILSTYSGADITVSQFVEWMDLKQGSFNMQMTEKKEV